MTIQRIDRVIGALLQSPNKTAQRAKLWVKLHSLRIAIKNLNN